VTSVVEPRVDPGPVAPGPAPGMHRSCEVPAPTAPRVSVSVRLEFALVVAFAFACAWLGFSM